MDKALFTASAAASALLERQALISNNIANGSTPGFKETLATQQSWLAQGADAKAQTRIFAVQQGERANMAMGPLMSTGRSLDVALPANAFLAVEDAAGNAVYTRRGDLLIDSEGALRLSSGQRVLGDGGPIVIPDGNRAQVGADGTVTAVDPQRPQAATPVGRLQIAQAPAGGAARLGDGFFSIAQPEPFGGSVAVGALEQSNVSMAGAMAQMIEASRKFEANLKVISELQEVDRKASDLLSGF